MAMHGMSFLKTASAMFGIIAILSASALRADDSRAVPGGIWKAVVPAKVMKGEFGNLDPIGVASGAKILADCSINWVNPDDGALYCFSSGTSLEFFLEEPNGSIKRARAGWLKLNQTH